MSKINILDSVIFNRIAAGEVVENPRSVVKELVENSIDAGADTIVIEINGGGIEYICVSDNGTGIEREDMPTAFMPHATSKICSIKDLENISTLGFRGEALPSIASVASVEMTSRCSGNQLGYKIVLQEGKIVDEGECGSPYGTKIIVKNLFANIPARAKFLGNVRSEEGAVTEFVIKIILANPQLKIKYIADGEIVYQSDGGGVESAIYNVYGKDFLSNMVAVKYVMPDITISGMICKPNFTKHNRNYQTLIVNGRYIVNSDISYCIQQCYMDYLMKRQFPAYVLYIDMPVDMVDVNVHPNKLDVRFSGEKRLKGIIYNFIKENIDALAKEPMEFYNGADNRDVCEPITLTPSVIGEHSSDALGNVKINSFSLEIDNRKKPFEKEIRIAEQSEMAFKLNSYLHNSDNYSDSKTVKPVIAEPIKFFDLYEIKIVGKLFNTYVLVESGDCFYIVDQHAAHERILYDNLVKQINNNQVVLQDLLVPYIFDVSPSEREVLCNNIEELGKYGFKIDLLSGNSFSLYAVPICCANMNLQQFVSTILDDMQTRKTSVDFIKESLMQAACKSAVKGEDDLNNGEILELIEQMRVSGGAKFCPHGRPTVIKFDRADLEKLFKRIL